MISAYKPTSDNWYGSYHIREIPTDQLVYVTCGPVEDDEDGEDDPTPRWLINTTGTDDYSLERMFDDEASARAVFVDILLMPEVNQVTLHELGFVFGN